VEDPAAFACKEIVVPLALAVTGDPELIDVASVAATPEASSCP
jgi:hypothetical protein